MLIIANLFFWARKWNLIWQKWILFEKKIIKKLGKFYFYWCKINVRNIHILSILEFHSYTYPFLLFSSMVLFLSFYLSLSLCLFSLSVCHPIKMAIKVLNYVYHPLSILCIYLHFNLHFSSLHVIDRNIYLSFSSIRAFIVFLFLSFNRIEENPMKNQT